MRMTRWNNQERDSTAGPRDGALRRRDLLRAMGLGGAAIAGASLLAACGAVPAMTSGQSGTRAADAHAAGAVGADEALERLLAGNKRYADARVNHPNQTTWRREGLATTQHPFAVILGCSDSRVPPELLFDQGLGDLFVIRVAGNIATDAAKGSIEYAVEHLGSPLVVVLGHERCGAVGATVDAVTKGATVPGHLPSLVDPIRPAVQRVQAASGDLLDNAVRANVDLVVATLKATRPILTEELEHGKIKIVGMRYDLDTGRVETIA